MATNCTSFPLINSSSSISTSKSKPKQQLVPSYPFISLTRRLSPPLIAGTRTATTYVGFTRSNTAFPSKNTTTPRPSPAAAASLLSDAIPEQTTITDNNATSTIISVLLFIAFIGLSILTIGVIYIAVTDFLQKREGEKFQKEEAERKKKSGGKKKRQMKARAGPKGFGQKIVEIDDEADI
ncbi:hypothetical protein QQ045_027341 [Rhodiola kirilowii]